MKKLITKFIIFFSLAIVLLPACNNNRTKDVDQHERIEGHSDPANTGGVLSGDRMDGKGKDTTSTKK
jgi:hypothetical protein